jgi:hypothetical protein
LLEIFTEPVFVSILAGGFGQLVRAALGLKKAMDSGKKLSFKRFFMSLIVGFASGAAVGIFIPDWKLAFMTGFGATDAIESVVQIAKG